MILDQYLESFFAAVFRDEPSGTFWYCKSEHNLNDRWNSLKDGGKAPRPVAWNE
jgi:predicted 3-demethylubiquinone-9 3-methyltransferase (glyoxalase superfamily)